MNKETDIIILKSGITIKTEMKDKRGAIKEKSEEEVDLAICHSNGTTLSKHQFKNPKEHAEFLGLIKDMEETKEAVNELIEERRAKKKEEKNILNYCNVCKFLEENFGVEYWCIKFKQFLDYEREEGVRYIIPLKQCKHGPVPFQ